MQDKPPTALRTTEKVSERKPGNFLFSSRRTHLPLQTTPKYKFQSAPSQSTKFAFGTSNAALPAPHDISSRSRVTAGHAFSPAPCARFFAFMHHIKLTHAREIRQPPAWEVLPVKRVPPENPESMLELLAQSPDLRRRFPRSLEFLTKCQFTTFSRFASSRQLAFHENRGRIGNGWPLKAKETKFQRSLLLWRPLFALRNPF